MPSSPIARELVLWGYRANDLLPGAIAAVVHRARGTRGNSECVVEG